MRAVLAVLSLSIGAFATFPQPDLNVTGGQCSTASYEFCCHVGKACMCNLGKHAEKQCSSTAFDYCCGFLRPCDCSKGPHSGPITCKVIDAACNKVFTKAVTSIVGCTLEDATIIAACEIAGIGPEDPLSDACAAILGTTVEAVCIKTIKAGGKFAASQCKKAAGCRSDSHSDMVVV